MLRTTYISVYLKVNLYIRTIEKKSYECHIAEITLRAEPTPGQYRPTRQEEEAQNQGERFAPCQGETRAPSERPPVGPGKFENRPKHRA